MLPATLLLAGCQPPAPPLTDLPGFTEPPVHGTPRVPPAPAVVGAESSDHPEWLARGHRPWRYIVVHHSSSEAGSAAEFDKWHRARGWDGLGYHFVITNGRGGTDGTVEVGPRWREQKWGAHTGGTPDNAYNDYGIGICLVGDFRGHDPSPAQLAALDTLVTWLAKRYGIEPRDVIGHRDAPGARTECPGDCLERYVKGPLRQKVIAALRR